MKNIDNTVGKVDRVQQMGCTLDDQFQACRSRCADGRKVGDGRSRPRQQKSGAGPS